MNRKLVIWLFLCAQTLVCAQNVLSDTTSLSVDTDSMVAVVRSDSIAEVLRSDSIAAAVRSDSIAAVRDSIRRRRTILEPTTAFPFHVGYADSLRIDSIARAFPYHPLAIKMVYMPIRMSSEDFVRECDKSTAGFSIYKLYNEARRYMTARHADLYHGTYDPSLFADPVTVTADNPDNYFEEKALIKDEVEDREALRRLIRNHNSPWSKQATVMLQISQNYVSKNWYAGGNSNFALIAIAQGNINYKSDKLTWENYGEWRAGANTVRGDSLRHTNSYMRWIPCIPHLPHIVSLSAATCSTKSVVRSVWNGTTNRCER